MKKSFGLLCAALLAMTSSHVRANDDVPAPTAAPAHDMCVVKLGNKTIELGNYGMCYLKGYRMRGKGMWAYCRDNIIKCYEDNAVADGKAGESVECIEPGKDSDCFIRQ